MIANSTPAKPPGTNVAGPWITSRGADTNAPGGALTSFGSLMKGFAEAMSICKAGATLSWVRKSSHDTHSKLYVCTGGHRQNVCWVLRHPGKSTGLEPVDRMKRKRGFSLGIISSPAHRAHGSTEPLQGCHRNGLRPRP